MNNIALIDESDYNSRFPLKEKFDINEMENRTKTHFFAVYSLYMKLFTEFLIKNTCIRKYDNYLFESDANFIKVDDERKDIYQKLNNSLLNYFYIRNNLYLNRLTSEEFDYLKNKILNNNIAYVDEDNKFILNTFKKLIFEEIKGDDLMLINYGPEHPKFFAPNNALVIGIRYDEFYNKYEKSDSEWSRIHTRQQDVLRNIINKFKNDVNSCLDCDVCVIKYDDFSIKKIKRYK